MSSSALPGCHPAAFRVFSLIYESVIVAGSAKKVMDPQENADALMEICRKYISQTSSKRPHFSTE